MGAGMLKAQKLESGLLLVTARREKAQAARGQPLPVTKVGIPLWTSLSHHRSEESFQEPSRVSAFTLDMGSESQNSIFPLEQVTDSSIPNANSPSHQEKEGEFIENYGLWLTRRKRRTL